MASSFDSFIFTHIPKCGGSSFRKFIFDTAQKSDIGSQKIHIPGEGGILNSKNLPNLNEKELQELKSRKIKIIADHSKFNVHKLFELDHIKSPFYFTILRDPVARVISHYNFFYFKLGYNNCKGLSLNDLPDKKLLKILNAISNLQVSYLINKQKQREVTTNDCERAIKILTSRYSSFGILENMDQTINLFRTRKPNWLNLVEKIPVKNVNKANTSKREPNAKILALIKELNLMDIILYNYASSLFSTYVSLANNKSS